MRGLILYLVILLVAVLIGIKIAQDPGYLLLAYHKWTIEMPLWFAAICILGLFWLFNLLMRFSRGIWAFPQRWQHRIRERRLEKSQQLTNKGLFALSAGDWDRARKILLKATTYSKMPWLNYMAAAFAANKLKAYEYSDAYLNRALVTTPESKVAVALARAQLQFEQQPEKALISLQYLRQQAPKQPYVLRLLAQTFEKLEDWQGLLELLPLLRKRSVVTQREFVNLEIQAYSGFLKNAGEQTDLKNFQKVWRRLPRELKKNPTLIQTYAQALLMKGANQEAEEFLGKILTTVWDDDLVNLYGEITSSKPVQQLTVAESWLSTHKHDATLLFVLGKLTLRNQLWGKARSYLEASIAIEPRPSTYRELGVLLERLDENNWAVINCYKSGLQLATDPENLLLTKQEQVT